MKLGSIKLAGAAILMLAAVPSAYAVGTDAGSTVTNTATVAYAVGGVNQANINAVNDFTVDRKADFTLTEFSGGYGTAQSPTTVPGASGNTADPYRAVLSYQLTNTGNGTQDFLLSAANGTDPFQTAPGTAFDAFTATGYAVYVESGATTGYQPAEDIATFVDQLAEDGIRIIYVVSTIPANATNGQTDGVTLTATVADGNTAGTAGTALVNDATTDDEDGAAEVVLADDPAVGGVNVANGQESATDAYVVVTAAVAVNKYSRVLSDPFNGTTNPKRIPGAVVEYCIAIVNSGSQPATGVTLSDNLAAQPVTYVSGSVATGNSTGTAPADAASCSALATATPGDGSFSGSTVSATFANSVAATNGRAVVRFTVTIN